MTRIIGITGTPGTGKKSMAPLIAKRLDLPCVGLNDIALSEGLVSSGGEKGEVDTARLRQAVERRVADQAVVHGHLFPYVFRAGAVEKVLVLRCEPAALKARLMARGYPTEKVIENVEAELIGVIASDSHDAFGEAKTREFDTSATSPREASEAAYRILTGEKGGSRIDWTRDYDSGTKLRLLLSSEV